MHSSSMANDERAGDDDGARDFDFLHGRWHVRSGDCTGPPIVTAGSDGGASWETNWTMQFTRVTEAS